nr:immunoglobulin heavy chain junction region [Macaca mulatta]MOX91955.1 immunoglobulin heavy chain junction region [Macaca mulatta]MOX93784.1 immunoglobulin heavy chain junction region [Macaca mulatta]MOX93809.1 immunoglobulin heavy chain junction region [Macaca mulatta]MOX94364.1 immunoglobulin heavy chain junction region [Macaca mulatta]
CARYYSGSYYYDYW